MEYESHLDESEQATAMPGGRAGDRNNPRWEEAKLVVGLYNSVIAHGQARTGTSALQPAKRPALPSAVTELRSGVSARAKPGKL